MTTQLPSETHEYKEAEKKCDNYARQLADQLLNRLNNTLFETWVVDAIQYPRQLILEKVVKILTDKI